MQLACSALYHVPEWGRKTRTWLRRLDHAAMFALIAGTYTPLCMLALDQNIARRLLLIEWGAAAAGIVSRPYCPPPPRRCCTLCSRQGTLLLCRWQILPSVYRSGNLSVPVFLHCGAFRSHLRLPRLWLLPVRWRLPWAAQGGKLLGG